MVRNYKRKTERQAVSPDILKSAAKLVQDGMSVLKASQTKGIERMTLVRYIKASAKEGETDSVGYAKCAAVKQIFSPAQEEQLAEHIKLLDSKFYGLSKEKSQKLAYDFASQNNLTVPKSWTRDQKAGSL